MALHLLRTVVPLLALLFALPGPLAQAHDPLEITADVRVAPEVLEVRVTCARLTALKVASEETGGRKNFGPQQFEEVRPALEKCARRVVRLAAGEALLEPKFVEASLTIDADIEFRCVFPKPPGNRLRFDAEYLRVLDSPDFTSVLQLIHDRKVVRHELLRHDARTVELALP